MKRTEKLNLPQFEASDTFQRADFNEAFSNIDNGIYGYRLAARTVEEETNEVEFDFTGIDLDRFMELEIRLNGQLRLAEGLHYLYFNDIREGQDFLGNISQDPGLRVMNITSTSTEYMNCSNYIKVFNAQFGFGIYSQLFQVNPLARVSVPYTDFYTGTNRFSISDVEKLTFSFPSTFMPGFRISIVGILG